MAPILETAVSLLALAGTVAEATPLLKPGRHASPGVANILSSSKRSLHNLLARYYGSTYGFTKPSPLPEKRDTSLPDGWSVFGCVAESTDERLLQGFAFSSSSLTPLLCVNECTKLGYTMAGTEFGDECYCANSYSGNGGGLADDSTCGMGCGGDSSETCGTTWYLNLYTYNSSSLASCSSDSTTTSSVASVSASSTVSELSASATESATSSLDLATLIADASSTESASSSQITGTETASSASATATSSEAGATITASATSSVATSSSTSTASIYEDSDNASEWYALGCAIDSSNRVLSEYSVSMSDMTVNSCLSACEDLGYKYAGVEFGEECYCSSTLASAVTYDEDQCNVVCNGDEEETCGGTWAIEIFELISSAVSSSCSNSTASATSSVASLTSGVSVSVTASASASSSAATSISETLSESASETVSQSASANETESATASLTVSSTESVSASTTATASGSATTADSTTVPSSSAEHQVWAHHMVGNTYSYTSSNWASDIASATAAGIDGFALNIGSDSWGSSRVSDAYDAAGSSGFKLFLSLDMTSLACASSSDAANLVSLVSQFASESAQATYNDKVVVSTFSGSDCAIDWQTSFVDALTAAGIDIFFIPSLFSDVSTFSSNTWMDGELNWNSGWPTGSTDITTDSDESYISALGDKVYAAAVSPFFYTHFSPSSWNKNWLYRSDDWLYCTRWEQLISMRETVKLAEILTWNDYGESSYIGSISGDLPSGSEAFVDGMTHTGLLSLTNYYATAFKTGAYPSITEDELVMWARPHPHDATATSDSIGRPTGYSYTEDYLYAVVMATEAATVTLTSGSTTESFSVEAGLTKLRISLAAGSISGTITRSGSTVASYDAGSDFSYTTSPTTYNYNYFVGSSSS
ncbi:glucan endo-1,3-alpha-glucosidase agn1 [Cryptococcus wingfieldii CBS 7118]|uniref:Glucan endo-1,3-alpha-glucosidase agn1 n=1 Tax=Cryptococcus wingfieldii CBS 7118 TaxID=1295528 RepID=A0A1E3K3X0_9TREE|nr:glucan endo-1,3-alpha-glucosidase agn1 [Cryptococcus wingfieldii CBS 7118]ODO07533.1 glucan endo-1,3-alpha-glucosidase agn1 [Cryptococcus wingfieldii CBS 7118]